MSKERIPGKPGRRYGVPQEEVTYDPNKPTKGPFRQKVPLYEPEVIDAFLKGAKKANLSLSAFAAELVKRGLGFEESPRQEELGIELQQAS